MARTEIKAVELVRQIRDELHEKLRDKPREEIKQFFRDEAMAANTEAQQLLEQQRQPAAEHA